jgi:hypothetical protein
MDQLPRSHAPASWIEALAESDADFEAGRIVSGEEVMRDLRDSLTLLEAKLAARQRKATARP